MLQTSWGGDLNLCMNCNYFTEAFYTEPAGNFIQYFYCACFDCNLHTLNTPSVVYLDGVQNFLDLEDFTLSDWSAQPMLEMLRKICS